MYGDGILYSGPTVLGNNLLTSNWTTTGSWTFTNNGTTNATLSKADAVTNDCRQSSIGLVQNKKYLLKFTISEYISGQLTYKFGGGVTYNIADEKVGRFTIYAINDGNLDNFQLGNTFQGTIEKITLQEITQGSDFEFTRATTGTRINEEGYIEDVPYNLLSYTEQLTNGYWNKINVTVEAQLDIIDPKNGRGAFKVTDTSGGGTAYLHVPSIADANYGRSVYARTVSGTGTVSLLSYYGNTNNLFTLTEQWQRFYVDSVTTSTGAINFYAVDFRAGDLTEVLLYAPQMTKSPDLKPYLPTTDRLNLPRLNYPVYGGCPSLLVEPQRTNSITYSNNFLQSTWGGTQGLSVTLNNAVSPEGILNAATVTQDGTNSNPALATNASITIGQTYTFSMFVKNVNLNGFVRLSHVTSSGTGCWFNLDDGTIGTVNSVNATIQKYPNNWYRITNTFVATTGGGSLLAFLGLSDANGTTALTGSNQSVLAYGAQLELGSYPTSYMPTSGSTFTRNEDQVQNSGLGTTDTFNSSEGVLFLESEDIDTSNQDIVGISDGTNNNRVIIINEPNNKIRMFVQASSVSTDLTTTSTYTGYNKVAIKYKANDFSTFINGEKILTDNSGNAPSAITKLDLVNPSGASPFYGNLKAVAVYKTALTDTELANLTSYNNHDLFIPYRSRMQMIGADQELQCTEHDITRFL